MDDVVPLVLLEGFVPVGRGALVGGGGEGHADAATVFGRDLSEVCTHILPEVIIRGEPYYRVACVWDGFVVGCLPCEVVGRGGILFQDAVDVVGILPFPN